MDYDLKNVKSAHLTDTAGKTGPLSGTTFAAKDNLAVAGTVTGAGNPTWKAEGLPSLQNAPAVQLLLDAGFELFQALVKYNNAISKGRFSIMEQKPKKKSAIIFSITSQHFCRSIPRWKSPHGRACLFCFRRKRSLWCFGQPSGLGTSGWWLKLRERRGGGAWSLRLCPWN